MNAAGRGVTRCASALLLALGAACGPSGPPTPPNVIYGHDKCAACGMILSEPKHAAALVPLDGDAQLFDDTGELVTFVAKQPHLRASAAFVHDYQNQQWVPATLAYFVSDQALATPMGTGTVAFATRSAAEQFAQSRRVRVMRWEELLDAH